MGDGQGRGVSPRLPRMGHQASPGMKMRKGSKLPGGAPEDPVKDLTPAALTLAPAGPRDPSWCCAPRPVPALPLCQRGCGWGRAGQCGRGRAREGAVPT